MDDPPDPELPREVLDQLALAGARFDQHEKTLQQWAEMAQGFYAELLKRFPESLATALLLNWQTTFFNALYQGDLDQPQGDT